MNNLDCSFVGVRVGVWHDGVMFNNESVLKSIARRVFPNMGVFASDGVAKLGPWRACLQRGDGPAWLTVSCGRDLLFRIEVRGPRVEATYALPAVMERADGGREYGTVWAESRHWRVDEWARVPEISARIRGFFDNTEEFCKEEAKVYRILEESDSEAPRGIGRPFNSRGESV